MPAGVSRVTWLLLLLFSCYAGIFIYRTSFLIDGVRYFSLFDDEMISMRYARNLAQGYGLVWNPGGQRVEGYTNLGWVLFMALVHLTRIQPSKISLVIQIASAVCLLFNLVIVERIARLYTEGDRWATIVAVVMTAFYFPLVNWSLQGTEVGVLTLLIGLAAFNAVDEMRRDTWSLRPYLLMAAASLTRIDFLVPFGALLALRAIGQATDRRRHLLWGAGVWALAAVGQTAFRLAYYGDLVPNTYYLKVAGVAPTVRMARGFLMATQFAAGVHWLLFLIPYAAVAWRRDAETRLLMGLFSVQVAYSIIVGGDAWENWGGSNRFITPVMPLFFVVFCAAVTRAARWLAQSQLAARLPAVRLLTAGPTVAAVLGICLVRFNGPHGIESLKQLALIERPGHFTESVKMVRSALTIQRISTREATVAVVWAGTVPYFCERTAIDLLGKSDPVIARSAPRIPAGLAGVGEFWPGHNKWDHDYSIGQLKPDLVTELWRPLPPSQQEAYEWIQSDGGDLLARRGSPHLHWDSIKPVER